MSSTNNAIERIPADIPQFFRPKVRWMEGETELPSAVGGLNAHAIPIKVVAIRYPGISETKGQTTSSPVRRGQKELNSLSSLLSDTIGCYLL